MCYTLTFCRRGSGPPVSGGFTSKRARIFRKHFHVMTSFCFPGYSDENATSDTPRPQWRALCLPRVQVTSISHQRRYASGIINMWLMISLMLLRSTRDPFWLEIILITFAPLHMRLSGRGICLISLVLIKPKVMINWEIKFLFKCPCLLESSMFGLVVGNWLDTWHMCTATCLRTSCSDCLINTQACNVLQRRNTDMFSVLNVYHRNIISWYRRPTKITRISNASNGDISRTYHSLCNATYIIWSTMTIVKSNKFFWHVRFNSI